MTPKDKVDLALKAIGVLIAAFGIWKYFDERHEANIVAAQSQSISYIQRFGDEKLVDSRGKLLTFWQQHPRISALLAEGRLTTNSYEMFVLRFYRTYPHRIETDNALFELAVFFDEIYFCRNSNVCDDVILDNFFCDYSKRFYSAYKPFYSLISVELGSKPIDANLSAFARECFQSRN